ncbi:MAG: hypothetical protein ACXADH_14885 [Candidatus Kariarchaeaceae archaeon]|jgi:hypothetical protein
MANDDSIKIGTPTGKPSFGRSSFATPEPGTQFGTQVVPSDAKVAGKNIEAKVVEAFDEFQKAIQHLQEVTKKINSLAITVQHQFDTTLVPPTNK